MNYQTVLSAFLQGKSRKVKNDSTDGKNLYYHGNKIAEHREDGLHISNAGWATKTTKERLNDFSGVSIQQKNFEWFLNGKSWGGEWIKINSNKPPVVDAANVGKAFDFSTTYTRTDGWRGYTSFNFAVAGANDTGMWSDSPCRSDVADKELKSIEAALKSAGIPSKRRTGETSNVFCVHHYVIVPPAYFEQAKQVVADFLEAESTQLLYKA
jgi:hypothetical protein